MDKLVYKDKGQFKNKPAEEVMLTDELSVLDLLEKVDTLERQLTSKEMQLTALKDAYDNFVNILKDKVIFEEGQTIIAEIDGQLERLKMKKVFQDKDINLKFYKVVKGELVEDKSKIMEMI